MTAPTRTGIPPEFVHAVRWALANGWTVMPYDGGMKHRPSGRYVRWSVFTDVEQPYVALCIRVGDGRRLDWETTSLTEALDLLVALGVLPVEQSSGYAAGYEAGFAEAATTYYDLGYGAGLEDGPA